MQIYGSQTGSLVATQFGTSPARVLQVFVSVLQVMQESTSGTTSHVIQFSAIKGMKPLNCPLSLFCDNKQ